MDHKRDIPNILEGLTSKVMRLVDLLEEKRQRIAELERQLEEANRAAEAQQEAVARLSDQSKLKTLANTLGAKSEESKEIKKKITEMIREIDSCLSHLNN